jgi:hypothetical protein
MYSKTTVFDLVLPRVLAGERSGGTSWLNWATGALPPVRGLSLSRLPFREKLTQKY